MFSVKFIIFGLGKWSKYSDFGWLGIRYLSAELKKEPDVSISCHQLHESEWVDQVEDVLKGHPDVIAIPAIQQNLKLIRAFSARIKAIRSDLVIIVGNLEATLRPKVLLQNIPAVDIAVMGESEYTFRELIQILKERRSLTDCLGIAYRCHQGNIVINAPRPLEINIDRFAFPDRTIPAMDSHGVFDIITSRGCRGSCSFCANKSFKNQPGSKLRIRSLENIMDEIQLLVKQHHAGYISISDDTFCDQGIKRGFSFDDFMQELKRRKVNIRFRIQIRSENVNMNSISSLKQMLQYGLDNIFIGFEAGNKGDMQLYGKIATIEDNRLAIRLLNEHQIPYSLGFIMFNPYSTQERLWENLQFLRQADCILTSYVLGSRLELFNGANILERVKEDGLVLSGLDDPLATGYSYRFCHEGIDRIWQAFQRLSQLPVDFIQLDMMHSFLKNMIANHHPLLEKDSYKRARESFYMYLEVLRDNMLYFGEKIISMPRKKANDGMAMDAVFSSVAENIDKGKDLLLPLLSIMNKRPSISRSH